MIPEEIRKAVFKAWFYKVNGIQDSTEFSGEGDLFQSGAWAGFNAALDIVEIELTAKAQLEKPTKS